MHLHSELEEPVQTLTLRLRLGWSITPNIANMVSTLTSALRTSKNLHSVTTNQHRIGIRVGVDGSLQPFSKVLLERGVFNNRNPERVVIVVHSFSFSFGYSLDLLDIADLKVALLSIFPLH